MARHHLIASDATIRAVKSGHARDRLSDGSGLYLKLFVKGGSHGWRLDYSIDGRRNTISLGTYPEISLSLARQKAEELRKLIGEGTDPSLARKQAREERIKRRTAEQRSADGLPPLGSFEAVAREWYAKNKPTWAASHSSKVIRRLEVDVFPWIGLKPVSEIRPMDVLAVLRRVEKRGAIETTHRVQQNCGHPSSTVPDSRAPSESIESMSCKRKTPTLVMARFKFFGVI